MFHLRAVLPALVFSGGMRSARLVILRVLLHYRAEEQACMGVHSDIHPPVNSGCKRSHIRTAFYTGSFGIFAV